MVLLASCLATGQTAPAKLPTDAQTAATAAQLAIAQQQAAIQQQLQQQVEAGKRQAGKNLATTAPKMSAVEELNQDGPCARNGVRREGDCQEKPATEATVKCPDLSIADIRTNCAPQAQGVPEQRPKAFILPEPGSEIAPPKGAVSSVAVAQPALQNSARNVSAAIAQPQTAAVGTSEIAAVPAIASPAPPPPAVTGVAHEIPAAPEVLALPVSSLPQPPEIASGAAKLPSARLSEIRAHLKHVAAKYDVSKIGERGVGKGLDFWSLDKERELGRSMAADVERDARLITDPKIVEYVNRVGQNLVRNSDARVPFVIKVIDNDEVNAFALPGGYFYVDSGLIMAANNEAQLAAVMAHEIAHVAARHATKNDTRQQIFNLASIPLIFIGGPVGYAVRQAVEFALPMSYLKFSRNMEREADLLGLEYAYATGYDPEEFVRFFESLKAREKEKKGFLAKAFSTHPMTGDRIKRAQKEIAEYLPPRQDYIVDTSEFEQVKARLAAIMNAQRISSFSSERPTLRRRENRPK